MAKHLNVDGIPTWQAPSGRAFLGIGAGGNALGSMDMKARPMAEPEEAVEFIRIYMSDEEAEYDGARMHSEWGYCQIVKLVVTP